MRALEQGRKEETLQKAQRVLRKAVHAVSLVYPVNTVSSAARTSAAQAEKDVKVHAHPSVQRARDLPTVPAAIDVRV